MWPWSLINANDILMKFEVTEKQRPYLSLHCLDQAAYYIHTRFHIWGDEDSTALQMNKNNS